MQQPHQQKARRGQIIRSLHNDSKYKSTRASKDMMPRRHILLALAMSKRACWPIIYARIFSRVGTLRF